MLTYRRTLKSAADTIPEKTMMITGTSGEKSPGTTVESRTAQEITFKSIKYTDMKRTLLCFILIGFFQIDQGLAQNYKFGKVSEEELEETVNPQDSSAHASILYKKVRVHYRYNPNDVFELITDVQERVKIYTREGFDYATRQISYYSRGREEKKK